MSKRADCIYYEDTYKTIPKYHHCKRSKTLYEKGKDDDIMCQFCRLWDSYIPQSASSEEKEKAIRWQNMSYDEQPDYNLFFGI